MRLPSNRDYVYQLCKHAPQSQLPRASRRMNDRGPVPCVSPGCEPAGDRIFPASSLCHQKRGCNSRGPVTARGAPATWELAASLARGGLQLLARRWQRPILPPAWTAGNRVALSGGVEAWQDLTISARPPRSPWYVVDYPCLQAVENEIAQRLGKMNGSHGHPLRAGHSGWQLGNRLAVLGLRPVAALRPKPGGVYGLGITRS